MPDDSTSPRPPGSASVAPVAAVSVPASAPLISSVPAATLALPEKPGLLIEIAFQNQHAEGRFFSIKPLPDCPIAGDGPRESDFGPAAEPSPTRITVVAPLGTISRRPRADIRR